MAVCPVDLFQVFNDSFDLYPLPCPGGYTLQPSPSTPGSVVCQCQDNVTRVILCEDDQDTVVIEVCVCVCVPLPPPTCLYTHT